MLLRRITEHVKSQNWFAVGLDFLIVVLGVFLGLQVNNWNEARAENNRARSYLERIRGDLDTDIVTYADRVLFWTAVEDYGATALAYANSGEPGEASEWELLLAFFQASQLGEFFTRDATYDELKSAGELRLIDDVGLRDGLANYYTNADNPALRERPLYREHVRGLIPYEVQLYIWRNCYRTIAGVHQQLLECDSPLSEEQASTILDNLVTDKKLIEELRFWMSQMHVAALIGRDRTENATQLMNLVDAQLGKPQDLQPTHGAE